MTQTAQAESETIRDRFQFGENPTNIALPSKQGTIIALETSFGVNANQGQTQYTYPLGMPKFRDLPLKLTLSYNSANGNGLVGQGFRLSLPFVERSRRLGIPTEASALSDSIDGELIETKNKTYRPRIGGSFSRWKELSQGIVKELKDGHRIYFGLDESSREGRKDLTAKWWVSRIEDTFGNYIRFVYDKRHGHSYLSQVNYYNQNDHHVYQVDFAYQSRPDSIMSYSLGTRQLMRERLKSVTSFWVGNGVSKRRHHVDLTYHDNDEKRSTLAQIRRYGKTNQDQFPATSFRFSERANLKARPFADSIDQQDFDNAQPYLNVSTGLQTFDFNADGLIDIVAQDAPEGDWYAWLNQGDATFKAIPFNADATPGFGGQWSQIADINADRKLDIIEKVGSLPLRIRPNTLSIEDESLSWGKHRPIEYPDGPFPFATPYGQFVDLDGDSRVDYFVKSPHFTQISRNISKDRQQISFDQLKTMPVPAKLSGAKQWADLNGDRLPDLYDVFQIPNANEVVFALNNGQGWIEQKVYSWRIDSDHVYGEPYLIDLDTDGTPELITFQLGIGLTVYQLEGSTFKQLWSLDNRTRMPNGAIVNMNRLEKIAFGDINGNSSTDMIFVVEGEIHYLDFYQNLETKSPYLLTSYETSLGDKVSFSYQPNTQTYLASTSKNRLPITIQLAERHVRQTPTTLLSGEFEMRQTGERTYQFENGYYDLNRNEFLGFGTVTVERRLSQNKPLKLLSRRHYYTWENNGFLRGRVYQQEMIEASTGFVYQKQKTSWELTPIGQRMIPWRQSRITDHFEKDGTKRQNRTTYLRTFDQHGLPKRREETHYLAQKPYRKIIQKHENITDTNWIVGLLQEQTLKDYQDGQPDLVLGKEFEYWPGSSKLSTIYRLTSHDKQLEKTYSYDHFGNIVEVNAPESAPVQISYDANSIFVEQIAKVLDKGLTLEQSYSFDPVLAKVASYTDENDQTKRYHWDGIGRLTELYQPGSEEPTYSFKYAWGNRQNPSKVVVTGQKTGPRTTYYDGQQRKIASQSLSSRGTILKDLTVYGLNGKSIAQAYPLANHRLGMPVENNYWIRNQYDALSRPTRIILPNNGQPSGHYKTFLSPSIRKIKKGISVTEYSANSQLKYGPEGTIRRDIFDNLGRTCGVEEVNGFAHEINLDDYNQSLTCEFSDISATETWLSRTSFAYTSADKISSVVTPDGEQRRYYYDDFLRLRRIESDELGSISFSHNMRDLVTAKTLSNLDGQPLSTILSKYDSIGRLKSQRTLKGRAGSVENDWSKAKPVYTWSYDEGTHSQIQQANLKNRLSSLKIDGVGQIHYGYDQRGNQNLDVFQNDQQTFRMNFAYDIHDRPHRTQYPDGSAISYEYDEQTGTLTDINGDVSLKLTYDNNNLVAGKSYPIALNETFSYHPITLNLERHNINTPQTLTRFEYKSYDFTDRILNANHQSELGTYQYNYQYDLRGQLRLRESLDLRSDTPMVIGDSYQYNVNGDILNRGSFDIEYQHEKNQIVTPSGRFQFSDFGRLISGPGIEELAWDAFSRVTSMQLLNGLTKSLKYHPDNRRLQERVVDSTDDNKLKKHKIFWNKYVIIDLKDGENKYYYYANDERFAAQDNGQFEYITRDYLNSETQIFNELGHSKLLSTRTPYGNSEYSKGTLSSRVYGFTGAISDHESNLNQMKSRYYSSTLGRFISPDLYFLENPKNSLKSPLEANLFSYAKNNPIVFIDPTGRSGIKIGFGGNIGIGDGKSKDSLSDGIGGGFYVGIEPNTQGRGEIGGYVEKQSARVEGATIGAGFEIGYYSGDSKDVFNGAASFERKTFGPLTATVTYDKEGNQNSWTIGFGGDGFGFSDENGSGESIAIPLQDNFGDSFEMRQQLDLENMTNSDPSKMEIQDLNSSGTQ
jgi:RHS repeat-associated protein